MKWIISNDTRNKRENRDYFVIIKYNIKKKIKILTLSMKLPLSVTTYSKGDLD